jgi:hypothetical protein
VSDCFPKSGPLGRLLPSRLQIDHRLLNIAAATIVMRQLAVALLQDPAAALADFSRYMTFQYDCTGITGLTFHWSGQYQRSAYDSAYLALAQSQGV